MDKMKELEKLEDKLWEALSEFSKAPDLGASDFKIIDEITHSLKSMCVLCEKEEGGNSSRGSYARGGYSRDSMSRGGYANNSMSRGSYARDSYADSGDSYGRHYVRGHYSRDDGRDDMMAQLGEMMQDREIPENYKQALRGAMEQLR